MKITKFEYMDIVEEYLENTGRNIKDLKMYNSSLYEEVRNYMYPIVAKKLNEKDVKFIISENKRLFSDLINSLK